MVKKLLSNFCLLLALSTWIGFVQPIPSSYASGAARTHQLSRLNALRGQSKEIRLIVGRPSSERSLHPALPDEAEVEWIYADLRGTDCLNGTSPIHLQMDFTDKNFLKLLESETFSQVIIDWSTWKFLVGDLENTVSEYLRILKPGGKLVFEQSVAGGCIAFHREPHEQIIYNYKNDSLAPVGYDLPFSCLLMTHLDRREELHQEARLEMAFRYQQFFRNSGFSNVIFHSDEHYPISNVHDGSRPINYFEIIK